MFHFPRFIKIPSKPPPSPKGPLSGENRKSKINKQDVRGRCAGLQITSGGKYIRENFVCRSFLNFRFDKFEMMI